MHLPDFVLLVISLLSAIAAGFAAGGSSYRAARTLSWIAAISFGSMGIVWSATSESYSLPTQMIVSATVAAIAAAGLTWALWDIRGRDKKTQPSSYLSEEDVGPIKQALAGPGGGGEIFGNNATIIGGRGGRVGLGGVGLGGAGGGGIIHGDGGTIIGGEGGSVDGTDIWYPPAQSGYIQYLESQGQTPDFGVQYPGAGGATGGWLQRQEAVVKIREDCFRKSGQDAKIQSSKIEDVPLEYINEKLKEAGFTWRARIDRKYWYLYYAPRS